MNSKEEKDFFLKYGICPYVVECLDSNGCTGCKEEFELCRRVKFDTKEIRKDDREVVEFT